MEIFGIGLPELALIMVIILVIFGPDQLPEIAKKLGNATRELRQSLNEINNQVNEIKTPIQEIKNLTALTAADTKSDSNLIVADEPGEPATTTPSEATMTPTAPRGAVDRPTEPTPTPSDTDSLDKEDLSTPM